VAILTLALGIGASTAIFSVIENVLLALFPYKDAGRLVYMSIHDTQSNEPGGHAGYSSSEYLDYAEQNQVFDRVIAAAEEQVLYNLNPARNLLFFCKSAQKSTFAPKIYAAVDQILQQ